MHQNAVLTIGLTDQSGHSICLLYGQSFHPYSIHKNHDTLCYVKFIYIQKSGHFAKIKTICLTFLYTKSGHFPSRNFSLNFWNYRRGGEGGYIKKNSICVTFLYAKNSALCVTCYIKKAWHLALHFYTQKTMYFVLRFYI